MKDLLQRLMEAIVVLALVYLLAGCSTFKGVVHDVNWATDKIDQSISVPQ